MSTLLEQASLVMIPSGYKEDVVYSQIPTDGSGDLSFTRASNGTRINSAGLVEVVPWNLFGNSENATGTNWGVSVNFASVTANSTTAPNGTNTGNLVIENTATGRHWFEESFSAISGTPYTISVYFKAKERTQCTLYGYADNGVFAGQIVNFNLSTGTVISQSGTQTNSIENVGNGWYRCSMTLTAQASAVGGGYFAYGLANGGTSIYQGDGTSGLYMWGRQLNTGTLKPYFPTTDRLNVPRLTYQNGGGGCPSLLLEKQSTNYARNWNLTAAIWDKNLVTVVANSATSPDGTNNAYLIYPTSSGTDRFLYDDQGSTSYTANANYTTTVYAKASGLNFAYIRFEDKTDTHAYVYFNLATGVVGSTTGSVTIVSKTIEAMGNGWYRLRVTANMGTGTGGKNNVLFGVADGDGSTYATASGTNGVLFYGPQSEQSDYPTSPIPTSGSSATRVADASRTTGRSSLIGQSEGTLFLDLYYLPLQNQVRAISITETSVPLTNRLIININNTNNRVSVISRQSGSLTNGSMGESPSTVLLNGRNKIALGYKSGDSVLYINGVQVATNTDSFTFSATLNDIFLMTSEISLVADNVGLVNISALFTTRLTNAELASITTI